MKKIFLLSFILCSFVLSKAQKIDFTVAKQVVLQNKDLIGLSAFESKDFFVVNAYASDGTKMIYLNQEHKGLRVLNQMKVLGFKNESLFSNTGAFLKEIKSLSNDVPSTPLLNVSEAINKAFQQVKISAPINLKIPVTKEDGRRKSFGIVDGVNEEVTSELLWVPIIDEKGNVNSVKLAWQIQVVPVGSSDWWLVQIDASNGQEIGKVNLTVYETDHKTQKDFVRLNSNKPYQNQSAPLQQVFQQNNVESYSPTIVNGANYLVIPFPSESPQHPGGTAALRNNPWTLAPGNATSLNWHTDGSTDYTITRGNNTWTTEDRAGTNTNTSIITPTGLPATSTTAPDPLTFNFPPTYTQQPTTTNNQRFAITNLFYWNNVIHDISYQYGFNEVAGNFQANNQGRGGNQNDYVIAIAQSSIGVNNANFATPPDGGRPRMRMYLWDPGPNATPVVVQVNTPPAIAGNYSAIESNFSPNNKLVNLGPITAQVVYYNDDPAGSTHFACNPPTNSVTGKIALIDRGFGGSVCTAAVNFTTKVKNAQDAGAIAVIVVNNVSGAPIIMGGGPDGTIIIPAVMISQSDGALFAAQIANNLNVTLSGGGVSVDGDLDNGIIVHEYGHGISNRLTGGGTSGCLNNAEQGGEGWSDYLGLMMTINWANATTADGTIARGIGTYASGESPNGQGIRPAPYSTNLAVNNLTYANMGTNPYNNGVPGTSPHAIGTIWCTALWEMTWAIIQQENAITPSIYNYTTAGNGGNTIALKLVMEGMKLQPCQPGFIDARDAILAADRNLYCGRHSCAIWTAFAKRGMGFGANQGSSASTSDPDQIASNALPPAPTISSQPTDVSTAIGTNATFTANAGSDVNLIYQWQVSTDNGTTWTNINCSIFPSLVLTSVTAAMNGYKYRAQVSIGCAITTTSIVTLTVTGAPAPSITLSSAPGTSNQTVCINAPIVNIAYTTAGGVTGATVTGLPTGVTGSYSAGVFTISGTPTVSGSFGYTVTTSGGTPNATATGTISVNAAITLALTSAPGTTSQTITLSSSITNISYASTGGVTNITASGLPSGVNGTYSGGTNGTFTINGTPTATGTFSYTITTSGGCGVSTATGSIIVVNGPSITLSSAAGTNNQTVCLNTSITSISYTTSGGVTGATVAGLPSGITGSYSGGTNGTFTISGNPSVTGVFNYTINTTGGSATASTTGSINVNPLVNVTLTSAAGTTAQTVNVNSPITNIIYSTVGGVTNATATGLPSGVSGIYSGGLNGNITISGTPSVSGTFNYTVSTAGGCGTQTRMGSIAVVTPPAITLTSAASTSNQTVCLLNPIVNITYSTTGGVSGATVTGLPAGVTSNYSGGTNGSFNISGSPSASGSFSYTITTSGGSPVSTTGTITVNTPPAAPVVSGNLTYCQGATATALTANGAGLLWYTVATGGTGTTVAPIPSTTSVGTTTFYVSQTTNGCEGARASISVTVNPTPSAPSVVSIVNYCQGATNATPLSATGSNLKWYTVTTGGTPTTTAPTPSTATPGTTLFYVSQTTGSCEGPRAAITVNVTTGPSITVQPSDITSCTTTATFTVGVTGSAVTYQWQVSMDGGTTFTNIAAATSATVVINNLTAAMANFRYRVVISSAGCGSVISNSVTAKVGTQPVVSLTATPTSNFNPSVNGMLSVTVNPSGNYTYQWRRNNNILTQVTSTSLTRANGLLDEFGSYQVTVVDVATGCSGVSNIVTVSDIPGSRDRLFISPNPTRGLIRVSYYSSTTAAQARIISLYDGKGARIFSKSFNVAGIYGFMDVDMTNFVSGTYMLILRDGAGNKIASESVIKQ